jgi:segregation and condensation protein A
LAAVTDDFLKYLKKIETAAATLARRRGAAPEAVDREEHIRILADFIVVASRLVFIKSKSLLPGLTLTDEEETDIKDLETRLKLYQALRPAMKLLARRWAGRHIALARPYFLNAAYAGAAGSVFYPGTGVGPAALRDALEKLFRSIQAFELERQVVGGSTVSFEETINAIVSRLENIVRMSFRELAGNASRADIIVAFIAILHLAREQLIVLEQERDLSDIIITKPGTGNLKSNI